jgi:hypothetical protein
MAGVKLLNSGRNADERIGRRFFARPAENGLGRCE